MGRPQSVHSHFDSAASGAVRSRKSHQEDLRDREWRAPNWRGANESGKSTLIEAIVLALTGRINGRSAADELNPYWFNSQLVEELVRKRKRGERAKFPEIDDPSRRSRFCRSLPWLNDCIGAETANWGFAATDRNRCKAVVLASC
ncbi:ATP-binding protein [Ramlibacter sp.]|uniref:ATP-binding protein n=1 Tax=Ramlibacter sp. TaxID=1917967 RepID=UPI0039C8E548